MLNSICIDLDSLMATVYYLKKEVIVELTTDNPVYSGVRLRIRKNEITVYLDSEDWTPRNVVVKVK